ncbi:MAG: hypothetical protein R3A47_12300 [Polyangiales bacterium]
MVADPRLLILDEPTNGLDPSGRREMLSLIDEVCKRSDASLIMSTHIVHDVESVCHDIIVLEEGRLLRVAPIAGRKHAKHL